MKKAVATTCKGDCPLTKVAELLSDTWTILIMRSLTEGPKRFTELENWLQNISSRTLTLKLKKLSTEGLIEKDSTGYYSPTKKGRGLKIIEAAMIKYNKQFLEPKK